MKASSIDTNTATDVCIRVLDLFPSNLTMK